MHWSWHGLTAVILATTLGGGYTTVLIIAALRDAPIGDPAGQLLTNLGGILAGALAGYLGGHAASQRHDHPEDHT